ncbi:MAG: hypothetical protein RR394_08745 [Oscillospiraceae bacterium]
MSFRKLRGVSLPYEKQGQIYFTCVNYADAPIYTQTKIDKLCKCAGGEYSSALRELLISGKTVPEVAMKHYLSEDTLARARRSFYKLW